MPLTRPYSQNQLRGYSSLFSRSQVQAWLRNDLSSIDHKVNRYDQKWRGSVHATYLDYLRYVYRVMESHYQNEYVYKNSFLNEWLIKEVGETNSKIFSEYRAGNAVADLVMFNGSSKAFEIKTENDSDNRLSAQLENYRKAFNQIYLIIPQSKLALYEKHASDVGLIVFDGRNNQKFSVARPAVRNSEVDADTIMHILHTNEYKAIVQAYFGELLGMTSFNQFKVCLEMIKQVPNPKLNRLFIAQMKRRKLDNVLSTRYYKEFNQLSLALKLRKDEKKEMMGKLRIPLNS